MSYVNISSLLRASDDPLTLAGGEDLKSYDDMAEDFVKVSPSAENS